MRVSFSASESEAACRFGGGQVFSTGLIAAVVAVILASVPGPAGAQVFRDEETGERRERREAHSPRLENALLQARSIQETNPDLALDILQSIFDAPEDSYYVTEQSCSLKDAAESVLLADSDSLLKAYERRFEPAARGMLESARRDGGPGGLREVARRYPLTSAGRAALMELAVAACDSGDAASVLRLVQRLRRVPSEVGPFEPRLSLLEIWSQRELRNVDAVKSRLAELKSRFPEGLLIDGRKVSWFTRENDQERWLNELLPARGAVESAVGLSSWRVAHGNLRRNAASAPAPPFLDAAWKAPLADRYDDIDKYDDPWNDAEIRLVNQSAADVESHYRNEGLHPLPVAMPLIANDLAIFAGLGSVKAFRLETGELVWSTEPVNHTLAALLAGTDSLMNKPKPELIKQYVGQRAYRDHVDASLSTDGKRVYHVGSSGIVGLHPGAGTLPASNRGSSPLLPRNYNYLQAYDIHGGLLLWELGGPPRRFEAVFDRPEDEFDFNGAFFCAAPIFWEGQLLCVIEQSRQLRIVAIDPEKDRNEGPPLWSQALLNSDLDLVYDADRRFAGVSVAMDGSTLIAALGNGTVVGFDVADRRWLWLHTYADAPPVDYRRMIQLTRGRSVTSNADLDETLKVEEWSDTRTLIAGRSVLVTPFDDSRLLCLDRESGQPIWTRPRDQAMFLAGVHQNVVVLVGKSDIRGLSLKDGRQLWTTSIPPASGRGVRMGSRYVLPLSTGEVLTVDLESGAPVARSPLASGQPAGNLAAAGGRLVTQTGSEFRAFRSSSDVRQDIEQRLASSPGDPAAVALRGELRLHQGEVQAGEQELRSIPDPPPRIRRVLAWALVNGLERDFAAYYTPDLKLDDLPGDAGLRIQAWSAVSRGLERRGDLPDALLAALRAGEQINPHADRLLDREGGLRVRENRLLRGRVEDLWAAMTRDQQVETVARIREHLAQFNAAAPEFVRMHEMLAGRILPDDLELEHLRRRTMNMIVVEQRLLELRHSENLSIQAGASLELLRIAVQDPRMTPAPSILADLTGRLRDVPMADGRTAGELADEILNRPDFIKRREAAPRLSGNLNVVTLEGTSGIQDLPTTLSEIGTRSPVLEGWTFATDSTPTQIFAADERGVFRFHERVNRGMGGPTGQCSSSGRLLLVETADGFRIFDAIAGSPVVVESLLSEGFDPLMAPNFRMRTEAWRTPSSRRIAPLRPEHLAYIKGTRLFVVDPLTRREHWSRQIETVADLGSDAEFVATRDPRGVVKVYRASDGQLVAETTPPEGSRLPDYRHDIQQLLHTSKNGAAELGLFHPISATWTWQKRFPANTRFDVLNGRDVAALEPGGRLVVLSGDDGDDLLTAKIDVPADLSGLQIFQDGTRVYVVAQKFSTGADVLMSIPRSVVRPISARVTALTRADGRTLWSRDFDRMILDSAQPGAWPFLVVTAAGEPDEANIGQPVPDRALLVDRQTGKTLHSAELPESTGAHRGWKVDAATGAVSLRVRGVGMQVSSGSEPAAPPPVPDEGPGKSAPGPQAPVQEPPPPPDARPTS